jgi:small subunit ribosomal protein S13
MARIAGVDLPKKKRIEYALTYIYGIGLYTSRKILDATGVDYDTRVYQLTDTQAASIRKEITDNLWLRGTYERRSLWISRGLWTLGTIED